MGKKILIVDDKIVVAEAFAMLLKNKGYEICTQECKGEDAIKIVEEEKPDIILLDISLPGSMDGITAGKVIKDRFNILIIYISGISYYDLSERLGNFQPDGFLFTPIRQEDILRTIELVVYRNKRGRETRGRGTPPGH